MAARTAKIREIEAKTLLGRVKQPDIWFGLRYNLNLYRGCQHRCIYCDSRSQCYGIDGFDREILVKVNAIDLLRRELARLRVKGTIGTGSMNDPYMPVEREIKLTGQALAVVAEFGFPVHVLTKSDLVLRDLDVLRAIREGPAGYAAVSFTITTADDDLGKQIEPFAPRVSDRLAAMRALADAGIYTGVLLMPVLPFLEDSLDNILGIVRRAHEHGASYILAMFGVTLRDRQRAYFYRRLDQLFPGMRARYEQVYGERYHCGVAGAHRLAQQFADECARLGVATRIKPYEPGTAEQLSLL